MWARGTRRAVGITGQAARELAGMAGLPADVRRFYVRAILTAIRGRDRWSLASATRPSDLACLLRLARGRLQTVELGTGTGWTSISLALADPRRRVVTYDPHDHTGRESYFALVDPAVRDRIELRRRSGERGPEAGESVEFLFLDSSHAREETLASFRAWQDAVVPDGLVAFHDYGHASYGGVREAIDELGLRGDIRGALFAWRKART